MDEEKEEEGEGLSVEWVGGRKEGQGGEEKGEEGEGEGWVVTIKSEGGGGQLSCLAGRG